MSMPPPPPPGGGYGQFVQAREHPQGTTILVLGILSLAICGLLGPFAWSMGNKALREMDANSGLWSNRGNVTAGRICGIISTCLLALGIVAVILFVALASSSRT